MAFALCGLTLCALPLASCANIIGLSEDYREVPQDTAPPALEIPPGRLVFHRFTEYYEGDSEMFLVDFPSGVVSEEIGVSFGLCNPMSGIFSPDGTKLLVMAQPRIEPCGKTDRNAIEVYELSLDGTKAVRKITENVVPDEDPQYSSDGSFIVFKHNGHVTETLTDAPVLTMCDVLPPGAFCYQNTEGEQSKPVVTPDGSTICYYQSTAATADIFCFDRALAKTGANIDEIRQPAVVHANIMDGRPMISGDSLYYTRWRSATNPVTYIARKPLDELLGVGEEASFCTDDASTYTDPCDLGDDLIVFSGNQAGKGGTDLFIAEFGGTFVEPLDHWVPSLNTDKQERGAAFFRTGR